MKNEAISEKEARFKELQDRIWNDCKSGRLRSIEDSICIERNATHIFLDDEDDCNSDEDDIYNM